MPDQELKIVAVEVPEESLRSYRVLKGGDRHRYSVSCGCLARSMATNGSMWRALTGM